MASVLKHSNRLKFDAIHKAFSFQREAIDAVKDLEYGAVFHEQGLGKTKIAIDIILYWLSSNIVDSVIVVTKKGLVPNWVKEFGIHTHFKPKVLSNNRSDNFYSFNSARRVYIAHYEVFNAEQKRLQLFLKTRKVAVILDESQKIKNPNAKLTQSAFALAPLFKKRIIMTGTPIANRPFDIWSQIYFLDQGTSLGNNSEDFKARFNIPKTSSDKSAEAIDFRKELSSLFDELSSFCVRETKDGGRIDLPKKVISRIECSWENKQWNLYQEYKKHLSANIQKNGDFVQDNADDALKRLLRLVQIASNPLLVDESYGVDAGKFLALDNLVEQIIGQSEKAIIWSSFTKNVDFITRRYDHLNSKKIHGKMSYEERQKSVESFVKDDSCKILVATPGAAKEGLTLTVANHVIFFDRGFSLDDYLQAQDRIHRISQTKTCHIYNLIMENSIDEWVDLLIESKEAAAKFGLGDISDEEFDYKIDYSFNDLIRKILDPDNIEDN